MIELIDEPKDWQVSPILGTREKRNERKKFLSGTKYQVRLLALIDPGHLFARGLRPLLSL